MKSILCFGELLLRLSPALHGRWIAETAMPVFVGGAELNAATALANWGVPTKYITALPDNYLAREIQTYIESKGINTEAIAFSGNRIGAYYLPQGTDLKGTGVIYDRAHSSFWDLQPGQIDWDKAFENVSHFHFSAISPALNATVAAVCKEALVAASSKNIIISVDLNYRAKLWQYGKQPIDVMPELVHHCHIIMGNVWAAEKMLGIPVNQNLVDTKEAYLQQAKETSAAMKQAFPAAQWIANTFRFDKGAGIHYYATLFNENQLYVSSEHNANVIVDKVGSGDCFMGGLLYGHFKKLAPQEVIDFAAAAAFNKLFIKGDATTATVADIQKEMKQYA